MVVVVMITLSLIAIPALRSFQDRDKEAGVATVVSRGLNQLKNQSRQRNRAYIVTFDQFNGGAPGGRMQVVEGISNSCQRALANLGGLPLLLTDNFGQDQADGDINSDNPRDIGLINWREGAAGDFEDEPLQICLRPNGSMLVVDGGVLRAPRERLQFGVQRFEGAGVNWRIVGPPRQVLVGFSGPARLEVN